MVRALVNGLFDALKPKNVGTNIAGLRRELATVDGKIRHLTAAVESGAALAPLIEQLATRQRERETLLGSIASAETTAQLRVDRRDVEEKVLAQVGQWRTLLRENRRQALREALDGPMQFAPEGKQYRFRLKTVTGKLITDLIGGDSTLFGVPNGIRTRVLALKGPRPGPLDDGDVTERCGRASETLDDSTQHRGRPSPDHGAMRGFRPDARACHARSRAVYADPRLSVIVSSARTSKGIRAPTGKRAG